MFKFPAQFMFVADRSRLTGILMVSFLHIAAVLALFIGLNPPGGLKQIIRDIELKPIEMEREPVSLPPEPSTIFAEPLTATLPNLPAVAPSGDAIHQPLMSSPVTSVSVPARLRRVSKPAYPPAARRLEQEGIVVLRLWIDEDGKVSKAEVEQTSGFPLLDAAALQHAWAHWRFRPAQEDTVPVKSSQSVSVVFSLTE